MSWNEIYIGPNSLIKTCRASLFRSLFLLSGLLFLPPFLQLSFGTTAGNYVGMRIARIEFKSPDSIKTDHLYKTISISPGQALDSQDIRRSIENLHKTREFAYIEVDAEVREEGLVVTFLLRPNFFFADFRISGDLVIKPTISNLVQLPIGEIYSHKVVDDLSSSVLRSYRDAGYYRASVSPDIQFLQNSHLVSVNYRVQAGPRVTIEKINITGSPQLSVKEILAVMKMRPGRPYSGEMLRKNLERIRKLYIGRGFLNANIRLESIQFKENSNTVQVTIMVDSGSFVYIELAGGKVPRKTLRGLVPIYEEASIDPDLIEEGRRNIEDFFKRQGYFDVTVESEFIEVPSEKAYQINYKIARGKRQRVVSIAFPGANFFGRSQLLAVMQTHQGSLTSKGKFSPELTKQDADRIRDLYLQEGFEQVTVIPSFEDDPSGINVTVTFQVNEGKQTLVSEIHVAGDTIMSKEDLLKRTNLSPGMPYSQKKLDEDRRRIESTYLESGYPDVKVESQVQRISPERVQISYTVFEGVKIQIADIYVVGNRLTKRKVITRTILFHEGDPLSIEKLLTSQQKLYSLGLFDRVEIVPVDVDRGDDLRPIIIRVEDASPLILGYGFGYQTNEGPRGTVEITRKNLFGLDRSLSFRVRASLLEQRGQITYREPRLFNRNLDSSVTLYAENAPGYNLPFNTTRVNASLQIMKRFHRVDNFFIRYNYETVNLSDVRVNPLATGFENLGTLRLSTFSTAWLRDTRDDPFEPQKGFFNTVNFSVAAKPYGSEVNLVSVFGQTQMNRRVYKKTVLATSFRLGLKEPFGSTLDVPISERFFAGGSTTLRGFGLDLAGPLDPATGAPLGGNTLFIANFELRIPVAGNFSVAPFYDAGNVFARIRDFKLAAFSNTLGIGLRYRTPFGPIRVDIGRNLAPPPGQPSTKVFFTIGNPF
jgi:outer membrane protein insertion porin family